ncbi:hypothetical protein RB594_009771 [Gaeumannomyces avenae]
MTRPPASTGSNRESSSMDPDPEKQGGNVGGPTPMAITTTVDSTKKHCGSGSAAPGAGVAADDSGLERRSSSASSSSSLHDGSTGPEDRPPPATGLGRVVSRVLSRTTTRSSWNPGPPPDGGAKAWLAVLGSHLVVMNTWGLINSFGLFQTYYVGLLGRPPSEVAWIGSMQVFLIFFVGTLAGRLTDAGYFRAVFVVGTALIAAGTFATAQCTSYWQFLLAQGVCTGLGNGCVFCPAIAVVSTWFGKKRSLAVGLGACGSATGGLVFPSMVRQLLPVVGFAWTLRAIALVQLACMSAAFFCLRPRVPPRKGGSFVDWASFRELEYTFYACGSFFAFVSVYIAFFYVAAYSRDVIGLSYTDSLNLLLVINGVGFFGRIVPNYLADRVGVLNIFVLLAVLTGAGALAWAAVRDVAGLYAWVACYGTVAGGIQSIFPAGLANLASSDPRRTGVRIGMVFTIVSFGALMGSPVAGALVSRMGGSYLGARVFSGASMLISAGFIVASRVAKGRRLGVGLWAKV